jgi:HEAT repeat protein
MIDVALATAFAGKIAKSTLLQEVRNGVVDFLAEKAKDLAGDELKGKIESLRSDAILNKQIQAALERAAKRWAEDSPDDELIGAVAESTTFADLPSVKKAVRDIAQNPFTKSSAETLHSGFKDVLPARFDEERIERGVNEFIVILQEEFVAIPALQPAIQAASSLNTANATAVLPNIEHLLEQLLKGPTATEKTLQNYLTWVIDQHRYLDPKGTMQTTRQVQVFLDEVYVSLEAEEEEPLSGIDRKFYEEELKAFETREDLRPEEREDFLENLQAKFIKGEERKASGKPVELAELARKHEKMVILGDPGAGKTTLLRYLALRHAQAKRQSLVTTEELGEVFLPVYLRISEYAENGKGQLLEDFLISNTCGRDHHDKALSDLINTSIQDGNCIVFLDGLDEVVEPNQRALISAQINSLIRFLESRGNRSVVTSRVAGYRSSPLDGSIPHYRVRDMNLEQIKRFLNQWCNAVERFQTPVLTPETQRTNAKKEIDSITHAIESNPGVRRLAANPLLLRTLALIHKTGARIPQRRIELYRLAADTLIRDWNLARGIPQVALAREADANRLLAELAAWMHENRPAGLATEGDIHRKLCESIAPLRGKESDHPDVETEADDFLDKIRHHTGLFVERAPRRFGFMHLTFEEYFTARWLVAKPRDAAKRIRNKLHRPRWEEPILLAIGFYGMEFPDDVTELVEEAVLGKNLGGPSPYEEVLFRDLLFAVRAIGDQDIDVQLRNKLADQFTILWLDNKGRGKYQTIQERAQNVMGNILDSQIGQRVVTALLTALKDENENVRATAATALKNAIDSPQVIAALLAAIEDNYSQVSVKAARSLAKANSHPKVINKLIQALNDKEETFARSAAEGLYNLKLTVEVLDKLTILLSDKNKATSTIAQNIILNSLVTPKVIPELIEKLRSSNKAVRETAAMKLRSSQLSEENINKILLLASDKTAYVRETSIFCLGSSTGRPKIILSLLKATRDSKAQVRESAASALGEALENQQVLTILPKLAKDQSYLVRKEIAYILSGNVKFSMKIDILLNALKDKNEVVRQRALMSLQNEIEQPTVIVALLDSLKDSNVQIRDIALNGLRKATPSSNNVMLFIAALEDKNEQVRIGAASALQNALDNPEAITALIATLKDKNENVRASAATALRSATDNPETVAALLAALKDENENVRASAATALSNPINSVKVVTALLATLKDENETVRASAATALSNSINSVKVVIALLATLKDKNETVRASAALALQNATNNPKVATALLTTLKDENENVRASAAYALQEIAKQFSLKTFPELPDKMKVALGNSGLDNWSRYGNKRRLAYDLIFDSLNALAPFPNA